MKKFLLAAVLLALAPLSAVRADPSEAFSFNNPQLGVTGDITVGYEFQVNSAIDVSALGMFDAYAYFGDSGVGLDGSHDVGIWSTSGALLASVTVSGGTVDPLVGDFRYASLGTDLLLGPGDYVIGAEINNSVLYGQDGSVTDLTSDVSYVQPELDFNGGFGFPNGDDYPQDAGAYFGPNFQFSAVPDSGGWLMDLAAVASLTIAGIRWNRRVGAS